MSVNYDDEAINDEDEGGDDSPRGLRRAANKSKKLEAELAELRRELAFAKAGIPMDDPKMKYFIKGYDGEFEPDAIRAAAAEAGFLSTEPSQDGAKAAVADSQSRVMAASAGAVLEDASEEAALARLEAAMQEGGVEAMLDVARQYGIPVAIDQ